VDTLFWQLSIDDNIDVQSAFSRAPKVARKCESKHWYACGADGRSGGGSVYGHVITKFSRLGSLPHFLTHGAPLRALRARELRLYVSQVLVALWMCDMVFQLLPLKAKHKNLDFLCL